MTRTVVVLPGASFGPFSPLPFFAMYAAHRRGAAWRAHEWSDAERLRSLSFGDAVGAVGDEVAPLLADLDPASTVVVAKSLGSLAAPLVADRGLPAVWLTPLLREPVVVDALRRTTAPYLLVGGSGDPLWSSTTARSLTDHVCEVADADHGLFLEGPLAASAATVGTMVTAVEAFLDEIVWPS